MFIPWLSVQEEAILQLERLMVESCYTGFIIMIMLSAQGGCPYKAYIMQWYKSICSIAAETNDHRQSHNQ
jgi:hypothetical protein